MHIKIFCFLLFFYNFWIYVSRFLTEGGVSLMPPLVSLLIADHIFEWKLLDKFYLWCTKLCNSLSPSFGKNIPLLILLCSLPPVGMDYPPLFQIFVGNHLYPVDTSFAKMSKSYLKETFALDSTLCLLWFTGINR